MASVCYSVVQENLRLLKELYTEYSTNGLVLELYGTFLMEMYNDIEKGQELLGKAASMNKRFDRLNTGGASKFSYFDENNGIIFISGNENSLGEITYINEQACDILSI